MKRSSFSDQVCTCSPLIRLGSEMGFIHYQSHTLNSQRRSYLLEQQICINPLLKIDLSKSRWLQLRAANRDVTNTLVFSSFRPICQKVVLRLSKHNLSFVSLASVRVITVIRKGDILQQPHLETLSIQIEKTMVWHLILMTLRYYSAVTKRLWHFSESPDFLIKLQTLISVNEFKSRHVFLKLSVRRF